MKRILSADNRVINHIEKLYLTSVINVEVFISTPSYIEFSGCLLTKESLSGAGFGVEERRKRCLR